MLKFFLFIIIVAGGWMFIVNTSSDVYMYALYFAYVAAALIPLNSYRMRQNKPIEQEYLRKDILVFSTLIAGFVFLFFISGLYQSLAPSISNMVLMFAAMTFVAILLDLKLYLSRHREEKREVS